MYDQTICLCFFFIPIFDIWTKHLVLNPNNALENIFRN